MGLWYRTLFATYDLASPGATGIGRLDVCCICARPVRLHAGRLVQPLAQGHFVRMLLLILVLAVTRILLIQSTSQFHRRVGRADSFAHYVVNRIIG